MSTEAGVDVRSWRYLLTTAFIGAAMFSLEVLSNPLIHAVCRRVYLRFPLKVSEDNVLT